MHYVVLHRDGARYVADLKSRRAIWTTDAARAQRFGARMVADAVAKLVGGSVEIAREERSPLPL